MTDHRLIEKRFETRQGFMDSQAEQVDLWHPGRSALDGDPHLSRSSARRCLANLRERHFESETAAAHTGTVTVHGHQFSTDSAFTQFDFVAELGRNRVFYERWADLVLLGCDEILLLAEKLGQFLTRLRTGSAQVGENFPSFLTSAAEQEFCFGQLFLPQSASALLSLSQQRLLPVAQGGSLFPFAGSQGALAFQSGARLHSP